MQVPNEVETTIRSRRTSKVLLPVEFQQEQRARWTPEHQEILLAMLETAAWAPFHKRAAEQYLSGKTNAPMPWRFHVLDGDACSDLLAFLQKQNEQNPDSKWSRAWQSKITNMVAACGALVQATWLPDPVDQTGQPASQDVQVFTQKNIEHVAAAGGAVQSLLVAAESHQWLSYWSSGGILRDEDVFDYLHIDTREQLIGSIFLAPSAHTASKIMSGGLRDQRGALAGWIRWV